MQTVSNGDSLHDTSNLFSGKNMNLETIWMKCQILFSGKNKKEYFKMSSAENFTQSAKR